MGRDKSTNANTNNAWGYDPVIRHPENSSLCDKHYATTVTKEHLIIMLKAATDNMCIISAKIPNVS